MGIEYGLAGGRPVPAAPAARARNPDRWFFPGMALTAAVVVFVGFAPSYYLRSIYGGAAVQPLVHLHGVVATAWMLLFFTQTALVSARRTDIHRRLGIAGAVLAPVVVVVSWIVAVAAARRGVAPPGAPSALGFLAIPIATALSFAILAGLGLHHRRRADTHKRLMLLATLAMLPPAFARFRWFGPGGPPVAIGGTCLLIATCLVYDRTTRGRIHPAFLWGGLLLMLSLPLRFALARTDAWLAVARWLTR